MSGYKETLFISEEFTNPTEYFCNDCGQLRLSLVKDKSKCLNCGSTNIITGKPGELDKETLKMKFKGKEQSDDDIKKIHN